MLTRVFLHHVIARVWEFFIVYLESLSAMKQLSNDEKTKLIQFYWSSARLVQ